MLKYVSVSVPSPFNSLYLSLCFCATQSIHSRLCSAIKHIDPPAEVVLKSEWWAEECVMHLDNATSYLC